MTKPEKILAVAVVMALLLKYFSLPFGGPLLLLSMSSLAFYYFVFARCVFTGVALKQRFKSAAFADKPQSVLVFSSLIGYAVAILCCGALFRLQHWAGGPVLLLFGGSMCFALLVATTLIQLKHEDAAYKAMSWRLLTFLLLVPGVWVGV